MTDEYLADVCKIGQKEKTCRYIGMNKDGFFCLKTVPSLKESVDMQAETMTAKGDNCPIDPDFVGEADGIL